MLKVHVKTLGTIAVLQVQGRIVVGETDILRDTLMSLSPVSSVILDLAQAGAVDAHGLGVMLELRAWTCAKGIRFELMNVTRLVSRVLEISRLDSVFQVTAGVEFFPSISHTRRTSVAA